MKIIFSSKSQQRIIQNQLKDKLDVPDRFNIRLYRGLNSAVSEAIKGINKLFLDKEEVLLLTNTSPLIEDIAVDLSREGKKLIKIDSFSETYKKSVKETLSSNISCAVICLDHPVTGQIYFDEEEVKSILAQKVFCVFISHHWHRVFKVEHDPYAAFCIYIDTQIAVNLLGSRLRKIENNIFGSYVWDSIELYAAEKAFTTIRQNKDLILSWEASLLPKMEPLLVSENRIFDRAIVYSRQIDSLALKDSLMEKYSIDPSHLCPLSLCYWEGLKTFDFMHRDFVDAQATRGCLIFSLAAIEGLSKEKVFFEIEELENL